MLTIVFSDRAFTCDVKSHKQSSLCTLGEAFLYVISEHGSMILRVVKSTVSDSMHL